MSALSLLPETLAVIIRLVRDFDAHALKALASGGTVPPPRKKKVDDRLWPEYLGCQHASVLDRLDSQLRALHEQGIAIVYPPRRGERAPAHLELRDLDAARELSGQQAPALPYPAQWDAAIRATFDRLPPDTVLALSATPLRIPGKTALEVCGRLKLLPEMGAGPSVSLRMVSARLFWGQSKVLDGHSALVAALLEKDECPYKASPLVLNVLLRDDAQYILFIENLDTFEQMCSFPLPAHLVYASGFRAAGKRLRERGGSTLFYRVNSHIAAQEMFEQWLYQEGQTSTPMPVYFWGDFDWAGAAILKALRGNFPGMTAWVPGYEAMLKVAEDAAGGHLPEMASKEGQQELTDGTGCPYLDDIALPRMRSCGRFVDQEAIWPDQLR